MSFIIHRQVRDEVDFVPATTGEASAGVPRVTPSPLSICFSAFCCFAEKSVEIPSPMCEGGGRQVCKLMARFEEGEIVGVS